MRELLCIATIIIKENHLNKFIYNLLITSVFIGFTLTANAVDVIEGNAKAPPPDLNGFMVSYGNVELGDKYLNSKKLGLGTEINSEQLMLRYTRTFTLAGKPSAAYIQPTFGQIEGAGILASQPDSSGMGDTAFAWAYWLNANHEQGDYLGLVGYLVAPTGDYDSKQVLNLGQNRYSTALQLVYQTSLNKQFDAMLSVDSHWFTDNDSFNTGSPMGIVNMEQDPVYSTQVSLMYKPAKQYLLGASYFIHKGGETSWNGLARDDEIDKDRYQLTARGTFPFGHLILQYSRDLNTENGFIEKHRVFLRYQLMWK